MAELGRKPTLAGTAWPCEGHHPGVREQGLERGEVGTTPDEAGEIARQVVGDSLANDSKFAFGCRFHRPYLPPNGQKAFAQSGSFMTCADLVKVLGEDLLSCS
jgi:hypothetical protein